MADCPARLSLDVALRVTTHQHQVHRVRLIRVSPKPPYLDHMDSHVITTGSTAGETKTP